MSAFSGLSVLDGITKIDIYNGLITVSNGDVTMVLRGAFDIVDNRPPPEPEQDYTAPTTPTTRMRQA